MPHWLKHALLIVLFVLLAAAPLAMQFESGKIVGVVSDDQGPVAMASIQARNLFGGATVDTYSDTTGSYEIRALRSGRYSLWVQAPDHDSMWIREVAVGGGDTIHLDIYLTKTVVSTQLRLRTCKTSGGAL